MTREEFEEALTELCPSFELRKDNKGQLIVRTGLMEDEFGELHDMNSEEVEVEFPEDEDMVPLEDEDEDEE